MGCDDYDYWPSEAEKERRKNLQSLRERRYRSANFDDFYTAPRVHKPCGLVVGNPDTHDKYCPAAYAEESIG